MVLLLLVVLLVVTCKVACDDGTRERMVEASLWLIVVLSYWPNVTRREEEGKQCERSIWNTLARGIRKLDT